MGASEPEKSSDRCLCGAFQCRFSEQALALWVLVLLKHNVLGECSKGDITVCNETCLPSDPTKCKNHRVLDVGFAALKS